MKVTLNPPQRKGDPPLWRGNRRDWFPGAGGRRATIIGGLKWQAHEIARRTYFLGSSQEKLSAS